MHELPTEWTALCALVFLLGLKHGFDADHLATIDGLTRFNARHQRPFARYCGALFSLGHGVVVLAIALAVGVVSEKWEAPEWLELSGAWVSIGFLTLLGVVNLGGRARCRAGRGGGAGRLEGPAAGRPQRSAPTMDRCAGRRAVRRSRSTP